MLTSSKIFDFTGLSTISYECVQKMVEVISTMDIYDIYFSTTPTRKNPTATGFCRGKVFRFEPGIIVVATAPDTYRSFSDGPPSPSLDCNSIPQTSDFLEEVGYIYKTPGIALSWFLCKLGYGSNASNFEEDSIVMKPSTLSFNTDREMVVKFYFEERIGHRQKIGYMTLASSFLGDSDGGNSQNSLDMKPTIAEITDNSMEGIDSADNLLSEDSGLTFGRSIVQKIKKMN